MARGLGLKGVIMAGLLVGLPAAATSAEIGGGVTFTWLGQAFFKLVSPKGKIVYVDPWATGNDLFPEKTDLTDADLILITHGHFDHLGDAVAIATNPVSKSSVKVVSIFEVMTYLWEQGVPQERLQPMNKGGTVTVAGLKVTMVEAVHSSGLGPFGPKALVTGGEAAGYIIEFENGFTVYHAGDTAVFGDMRLIGEIYRPQVVLLPIGGIFTMGPAEAAKAVSLLRPKVAIPMHFSGTFTLPGTPKEFTEAVRAVVGSRVRVIVLAPGLPVE